LRKMSSLTEVPGGIEPIFWASSREPFTGVPLTPVMMSPALMPVRRWRVEARTQDVADLSAIPFD